MSILLDIQDLKVQFKTYSGLVKAVDGVSFKVGNQEIIGLVGESGCGKSVSMLATMQLIPMPPGEILGGKVLFDGNDLLKYAPKGTVMSSVRGAKIGMIFQEPMTSLNPVLTICRQMTEMLEIHLDMNADVARRRAIDLLKMVGIPDAEHRIDDYPHQFSGGMRQRIMIAIVISCNPKVIIADEPTTALDVTTQAQLMELMTEIVNKFNASLIIITHNLGVVARYVQRIYVMYAGRVIETGPSEEIFYHPCHPYTLGLLKSVPRLGETRNKKKLVPINGIPPNLINMPPTCAFLPRCTYKTEQCEKEVWPELKQVREQHSVACYAPLLRGTG
jgi:peptide/nickel transport system ATP-binding protein